MAFIHTVPEDEATADVKDMYDKIVATQGYIPNYTKVFSASLMPRFLTSLPQPPPAAFLAKRLMRWMLNPTRFTWT